MPAKNRPPDLSRFFGKRQKKSVFHANLFDFLSCFVSFLCGIGAVWMYWIFGHSHGAEFLAICGLIMAIQAIVVSWVVTDCDFRLHSIALVLNMVAFLLAYLSKLDFSKITDELTIFLP